MAKKDKRIPLHTTISRREYAELKVYQDLELAVHPTMESLIDFIIRSYLHHCRDYYQYDQATVQRLIEHHL